MFVGFKNISTSFQQPDGSSPSRAAKNALAILRENPRARSTNYWIKPDGYVGDPFLVYCDMDGTGGGPSGGGWMRILYSADLYSQGSPWSGTGQGAPSNPAYSGDFSFVYTDAEISALLSVSTEARQRFESWGYGSVGWTYQGQGRYQGALAWDNQTHRGEDTADGNSLILGSNKPASISYSFSNYDTFNNSGTDPTDVNDAVWRQGIIYIRDTSATKLPLRGIYNADVDGASEQRYFPLVSGVGSHTWVR